MCFHIIAKLVPSALALKTIITIHYMCIREYNSVIYPMQLFQEKKSTGAVRNFNL